MSWWDFTSTQLKETSTRKTNTTHSGWHLGKICTWGVKWSAFGGKYAQIVRWLQGDCLESRTCTSRCFVAIWFLSSRSRLSEITMLRMRIVSKKETAVPKVKQISRHSVAVNFWVVAEMLTMRTAWLETGERADGESVGEGRKCCVRRNKPVVNWELVFLETSWRDSTRSFFSIGEVYIVSVCRIT